MLVSTPIAQIPGIGSVTARRLNKMDIFSVRDLILHLPFRYEDFSQQSKITDLEAGTTVNISGVIELIQNKRSPKRRMYLTEALINDGSDSLRVLWFNQPFITKNLHVGDEISLAGRVSEDFGGLVMQSPQYEKLHSKAIHTQGIVPVYHLSGALAQKTLRSIIAKVIQSARDIPDWLPSMIVKEYKLEHLSQALEQIHFPETPESLSGAKQRLAFNELFLLQLRAQQQKRRFARLAAPKLSFDEEATKRFVKGLPFDLTADQKKVSWEIIKDLQKGEPMLRLLQGDVGSGKTVVASVTMLNAALSKVQSALMAPTEILAYQHFKSLREMFADFDITIALLSSGFQKIAEQGEEIASSKKDIKEKLKAGEIDIIIGTQALIQTGIDFKNLGFVVVDEQHRFGVEQRKVLTEKVKAGTAPHLLSMTATPIPRSLALAIYGDLEVSTIKAMPLGRKQIMTKLVAEEKRGEMYDFVSKEIKSGNQAFVICPLIDESDILGAVSVKKEFERLNNTIFKEFKLAMLHGRMKSKEREEIMNAFASGEIDILVATSIIEIGVDIPKATVMIVEDADRFGLAQLHQYRGRVGRRTEQAFCFLLTRQRDPETNHRLQAMLDFSSGFDLARIDLKFRGPGEVYGLEQKGFPELQMANFYDLEMMAKAREAAIRVLEKDAELSTYPEMRAELGSWQERAHLE